MPRDQSIENHATTMEWLLSPRFTPQNIRARLGQLWDPHVEPLNQWVLALREDSRLPDGAGATIPFFDPRGGGIRAKVLLLMQDPSEVATFTGFISPDNNDRTAHNTTLACHRAALATRDRVHWNIFPWWVNVRKSGKIVDPTRPPQTHAQARPLAAQLLDVLVDLLSEVQAMVLFGNEAQRGFDQLRVAQNLVESGISILRCPSCSPQSWNNVDTADPRGRRRSEIIMETLAEAARQIR